MIPLTNILLLGKSKFMAPFIHFQNWTMCYNCLAPLKKWHYQQGKWKEKGVKGKLPQNFLNVSFLGFHPFVLCLK